MRRRVESISAQRWISQVRWCRNTLAAILLGRQIGCERRPAAVDTLATPAGRAVGLRGWWEGKRPRLGGASYVASLSVRSVTS
jgi:hypothetical protein